MQKKPSFFARNPLALVGIAVVIVLIAVGYLGWSLLQSGKHPVTSGTPPVTGPTAPPVTGKPGSTLAIEQTILDNIKQNGFNSNSAINHGMGGLYINWMYGTSPLQTNFAGNGQPDPPDVIRHDPLTDLRYIHSLWVYKSQHPGDTRYDSEVARYTPIIKADFANTTDERGWLYDEEFIDLYNLSHDDFYKSAALSLVRGFAAKYDPNVGTIYKKSNGQTGYRPDLVLESGLALIQAGTQFQNPDWVQKGQSIVNFVYSHSYIAKYHTFPDQMGTVLNPDGTVTQAEPFYVGKSKNFNVSGNETRVGGLAQMIISLLNTYKVTHNQDFLNKATDLLDPLTASQNSLGLWDPTNKGYFAGILYTGNTPQDPGTIKLASNKKEAGRQVTLLVAFHMANKYTNNKYQDMEQQMRDVAMNKVYYAPGHGVIYEVKSDWSPIKMGGFTENWVTTEAMGAELEGLYTITESNPNA